jgi:hypothetical protein
MTINRNRWIKGLALATAALAGCFYLRGSDDVKVPYPEGYRHWTFLHTSLIPPKLSGFWKRPCEKPCTGGIFHFYANEKAMEGLRTGVYPNGAILAEELLELLGRDSGGGKEGPRHLVGVMVKDSDKYAATGGWGFGTFDGVTPTDELTSADRTACFECHIPRKDHGYVFTEYQER